MSGEMPWIVMTRIGKVIMIQIMEETDVDWKSLVVKKRRATAANDRGEDVGVNRDVDVGKVPKRKLDLLVHHLVKSDNKSIMN